MRLAGSAASGHGIEPEEPVRRVARDFDNPAAASA
jgi:hypothetical protein